jgi:hypothetical protein
MRSVLASSPRINHRDGELPRGQRGDQATLDPARRFQHNQSRRLREEKGHELLNTFLVIRELLTFRTGPYVDVQDILRNIDANEHH